MRVRLLTPADRRARSERRPHAFGRPAEAAAEPEAPAQGAAGDEHVAERRHRASVAPEDTAHYGCGCGFQFQAPVSTSVSCPHCGATQAW